MVRENATQPVTATRQKAGQGQRRGERAYLLPWAVAKRPDLSSGAKLLFSVLYFKAGGGGVVEITAETLAKCMRGHKGSINRLICELKSAGLVRPLRGRTCSQYHLTAADRCGGYIPILPDVLKHRKFNLSILVVLHYIRRLQGDDGWCRPKQRDIAKALGLKPGVVSVSIGRLGAKGLIQARPLGNSHKAGNKYRVTYGNCSQAMPE